MAQYTGNMTQTQFLTVKNIFDFLTKNWFPRSRQVNLYTQCPGVHRQPRGQLINLSIPFIHQSIKVKLSWGPS